MKDWKCPSCESKITFGEVARYQTLDEHVCSPNSTPKLRRTLICSNRECITRKKNIFWDEYGDRYGGFLVKDSSFINQNDSPFGSLGRRLNVEVHKKGVKDKTYLSPLLLFNIYQPVIVFDYTADVTGKVLKKRFHIEYLKRESYSGKKTKEFCIYVIPFWKTFKYLNSNFKHSLHVYKETKNDLFLTRAFEPAINRAWVYRTFEKITQILYPFYFKEYKRITEKK